MPTVSHSIVHDKRFTRNGSLVICMRTIQILRMRRKLDGNLSLNAKKNEAEFIPRAFPSESSSKEFLGCSISKVTATHNTFLGYLRAL